MSMSGGPATEEEEFRWGEMELERQRNLRGGYVQSGIPESMRQQIYLQGLRAGKAQHWDSSRDTGSISTPQTQQSPKPEPASPVFETAVQDQKGVTRRTISMYSDKNEEWVELTATFDSGTPDNWMTKEVVDLLDHAIVTVPFERYQTFTGEVMGSSELVHSVLWHGDSARTRSRSTDFRVINKPAPFEVLFGSKFLFSESVYSFNEPNLILTKMKESPENKMAQERNRAIADAQTKEIAEERKLLEAPPPSKKKSRMERKITEKEKERRR